MKKEKDDCYIDICVIPPLKETIEGFGDPSGPFARYNEMYAGQAGMLNEVKKDPVGFLLALNERAPFLILCFVFVDLHISEIGVLFYL